MWFELEINLISKRPNDGCIVMIFVKHPGCGMRRALTRALAIWGYESIEINEICRLYNLGASADPSVVLLGLSSPITDTISFLEMLAANPDTATIPAIILAASDESRDRELCLASGAFAYLGGNWTLADLRIQIALCLSHPS